jgi:hypothetical protein
MRGQVSEGDRFDNIQIPAAADTTRILEFKLTSTTESFVRIRVSPESYVDVDTVAATERDGYAYDPGVNEGTYNYITLELSFTEDTDDTALANVIQFTGTAAYTLTLKEKEQE